MMTAWHLISSWLNVLGEKKWEKISFRGGGGGANFPFFAFSANLIGFFFCKKLESICIDHLTSHPTPPDCFRGKLAEKKFPITWEKSKNQKNLKKSGFWLENAQNHACQPQFFDKFIPVVYLRYSNVFQVDRKLCFLSRPSGVRRGQNSRFSSQLQNDWSYWAESFSILSGLRMRSFWHPGCWKLTRFSRSMVYFVIFRKNGSF